MRVYIYVFIFSCVCVWVGGCSRARLFYLFIFALALSIYLSIYLSRFQKNTSARSSPHAKSWCVVLLQPFPWRCPMLEKTATLWFVILHKKNDEWGWMEGGNMREIEGGNMRLNRGWKYAWSTIGGKQRNEWVRRLKSVRNARFFCALRALSSLLSLCLSHTHYVGPTYTYLHVVFTLLFACVYL